MKTITVIKGGKGSGNFSHAGRPGKIGGSGGGSGVIHFQPGQAIDAEDLDAPPTDFELERASWQVFHRHYADIRDDQDMNSQVLGHIRGVRSDRAHQPDGDAKGVFIDEIHIYDPLAVSVDGATNSIRSDIKNRIITSISQETGVDYDTVNNMVAQWAYSSNDHSIGSLSLQEAAAEELGVELSPFQKKVLGITKNRIEDMQPEIQGYRASKVEQYLNAGYSQEAAEAAAERVTRDTYKRYYPLADRVTERKVIRAVYERTQARLNQQGVGDYVTLYRGVFFDASDPRYKMKFGTKVRYHGNSMESWSYDYHTAVGFGSVVLAMRVPRTSIISTAVTGLGCFPEGEYIVTGVSGSMATVVDNTAIVNR